MIDTLFSYPERRALEDAAFGWGMTPTRIFALLWPVAVVTISADVVEEEDYELIDRYLSRGIAEGEWSTTAELAAAFGLEPELVDRALRALVAIGHIRPVGLRWQLTELGWRSVREQRRFAARHEDRRKLYFDEFRSHPLPRTCYASAVALLRHGDPARGFTILFSETGFDPQALTDLANNPDRQRFNLPAQLDNPRQLGPPERRLLQGYVVRGMQHGGGVRQLAYSQASGEADADLTDLANRTPEINAVLDNEPPPGQAEEDRARDWLRKRGLDKYAPVRQRTGLLRVTLPTAAFGGNGVALAQLGSFETTGNGFFQLWCTDLDTRRAALVARLDSLLSSRSRVERDRVRGHVDRMARQFELGALSVADVRDLARRTGRTGLAAQLDTIVS